MRILITGSSRGIGRQLAEYYLGWDAEVWGFSRSFAPAELTKWNTYHHHTLSVSDEESVSYTFKTIPPMDVIINNAGIASMNSIITMPLSTVRQIVDTNFIGTFLVSREGAKRMKSGGRIINFSSIAVPMNLEGESVYAASKAAIESITRTMAREFTVRDITVNCIGLPPIDTDLIKNVPQEKIDAIINRLIIKRKCEMRDIINAIQFFTYSRSDYVSGQTIYLGGL